MCMAMNLQTLFQDFNPRYIKLICIAFAEYVLMMVIDNNEMLFLQ